MKSQLFIRPQTNMTQTVGWNPDVETEASDLDLFRLKACQAGLAIFIGCGLDLLISATLHHPLAAQPDGACMWVCSAAARQEVLLLALTLLADWLTAYRNTN